MLKILKMHRKSVISILLPTRLFISYRRNDSAALTGRLADTLKKRFGSTNVFYDLDSVTPGMDFDQKIRDTLPKVNYTLAVIGPHWLSITDAAGKRRLDDEDDPVRMELALALRSKSPVIPILVGDTRMPVEAELPAELRDLHLATRNAVQLTDQRWAKDVDDLITFLAGRVWWRRVGLAAVAFTAIVVVGLWIYQIGLQNTIGQREAAAAVSRERYIQKMRSGSDECMAGTWPEGTIRGPTYRENGNMVTEVCRGVSGALDYFSRFFNNEELWRMLPSSHTATEFAATYKDTFGPSFEDYLAKGWTTPLSSAAVDLAEKAKNELAAQAQEVVSLKQDAGRAADRLRLINLLVRLGLYWTAIIGIGVFFWFVRGAIRL